MYKISDLPLLDPRQSETGCCPRFLPEAWDGKFFRLDSILFAKAPARSLLYIPLNIGSVMARAQQKIAAAGAEFKDRYLILSQDETPFRCQHYFWVSKEVPGLEMVSVTGVLFSKVYEGSYDQIPKWIKDLKASVNAQGLQMKDVFSFYTTCPKCAKTYGKNYVVLFARLKD